MLFQCLVASLMFCEISSFSLLRSRHILNFSHTHKMQATDQFETAWASAALKIGTDRIGLTSFVKADGSIRGLGARASINKNNVVVSIKPKDCLYVPETGNSCTIPGLESIWDSLNGNTRLSLLLLSKYDNGCGIFLNAYIKSLPPQIYKTPIHWKDTNLDNLPYEFIKRSVETQKSKWREVYNKIITCQTYTILSYEHFVWAMEIVRSRAFSGIDGLQDTAVISAIFTTFKQTRSSSVVLLPIIDSCNHNSMNPSCQLIFSPISNSFELLAIDQIQAHTEITMSYGNRHNDDLLQYFGFIELHNKFDRYVVIDPLKKILQTIKSLSNIIEHKEKDLIVSTITTSQSVEDVIITFENTGIEKLLEKFQGINTEENDILLSTIEFVWMKVLENELKRMESFVLSFNNNSKDSEQDVAVTFIEAKMMVLKSVVDKLHQRKVII